GPAVQVQLASNTQQPQDSRQLAVIPASPSELDGWMPLLNIEQAIQRRAFIVAVTKQLMQEGVDYGKIPGTSDKPALLKPGAEKLCNLFGMVARFEFLEKVEDWTGANHNGEPFFYYQIRA